MCTDIDCYCWLNLLLSPLASQQFPLCFILNQKEVNQLKTRCSFVEVDKATQLVLG